MSWVTLGRWLDADMPKRLTLEGWLYTSAKMGVSSDLWIPSSRKVIYTPLLDRAEDSLTHPEELETRDADM